MWKRGARQTLAGGGSGQPGLAAGVGLKDPERSNPNQAGILGPTGISVSAPPDEPRNVSCIQDGTRGRLNCTWDKGRITYLDTAYCIE